MGVAVTSTIAGCNALQDNSNSTESTEKNPTPTQTAIGSTATESGEETDSSPTEKNEGFTLKKESEGKFEWAGSRNDALTILTYGNRVRIIHDGEQRPLFENVIRPIAVDGGIAYTGERKENGTLFESLMVRGEEQARINKDDGGYIALNDVTLNDEPIWRMGESSEDDGVIYHGSSEIKTGYDTIFNTFVVNGDIGFVGKQDSFDEGERDIVVDGSVVHEQVFTRGPVRGIDGKPTFIRLTQEGEVLQHGDQQLGNQYINRASGEIRWFDELGGSLGFKAKVREDQQNRDDRQEEEVLWYDGQEVIRHSSISDGLLTNSRGIAMIDEGIAYTFSEPETQGIAIEGDVIDERGGVPVESIGGDLAYPRRTDKETIIYDGKKVAEYEEIETIFELDGNLAFLGYTEPAESYGEIVSAN